MTAADKEQTNTLPGDEYDPEIEAGTDEESIAVEARVDAETAGKRFDAALPELFPEQIPSRSRAQKLIEDRFAILDGKYVKAGAVLREGSVISVIFPETEEWDAAPEDIPLNIVYEDGDIIVINKPRGMVVHPAAGNQSGTLVNALLNHCRDLSGIGGVIRPGIVHRIDKDTTGLLVVAKNDKAHLDLAEQLKKREMHRIYMAVAEGIVKPEEGTVNAPVGRSRRDRKKMDVVPGGRSAVTNYRVLCTNEKSGTSLLGLSLDTGRTHQIRVHLKYIGHPVSGDRVYGLRKTRGMEGQALHAGILLLRHPVTGEKMRFSCPPPEDMEELIVKAGLRPGEELFERCDW